MNFFQSKTIFKRQFIIRVLLVALLFNLVGQVFPVKTEVSAASSDIVAGSWTSNITASNIFNDISHYPIQSGVQLPNGEYLVAGQWDSDASVFKTDSQGGYMSRITFGGSSLDIFFDIALTSDGGYVAVGKTLSLDGDLFFLNPKGGGDAIIVKYNSSGVKEWSNTYGGTGIDQFYSIAITSDGQYVAVGSSNSSDGDLSGKSMGAEDAIVVKYNPATQAYTGQNFGSNGGEEFKSVLATTDGGFITAGSSNSAVGGDIDPTQARGNYDGIIVKYNASAGKEWNKNFGGTGHDIFNSIIAVSSGYVVAGTTNSSDLDLISNNNGGTDGLIVKYDLSGTASSSNNFGGSGDEAFYSVIQSPFGGFVAAGTTNSSNGDLSTPFRGFIDGVVARFDSSLNLYWNKSFGGSDFDTFSSVLEAGPKKYAVLGWTSSTDGDLAGKNFSGQKGIFNLINEIYLVTNIEFNGVSYTGSPNQQFTIGRTVYPINADDQTLTWSSSDPSIATVDQTGKVTTLQEGTVNITATSSNSIQNSVPVYINYVPVTSVTVNPPSNSLPIGDQVYLTATVAPTYANPSVTWSSSDTSIATVNAASGVVTAVGVGPATITATSTADGTKFGTSTINVSYAPATGVTVSPSPQLNLVLGGTTGNVTATVAPSTASQSVTWSSSNTSIATVNAASGVVTAVGVGIAEITATAAGGGVTGTTLVVVSYAVAIGVTVSPSPLNLVLGGTGNVTATVAPSSASQSVTWSSSDTSIATVNAASGLVTAVGIGIATITATAAGGVTGTTSVDVSYAPATGVTVFPSPLNLVLGGTTGNVYASVAPSTASQSVTWSSSDTSIATVNAASGLVTAKGKGIATITATALGGVTGTTSVDVSYAPATSVTVFPPSNSLPIGDQVYLTATVAPATYANPSVTWSSSDTSIATVNASGVVTAVGIGIAIITATVAGGVTGTTLVGVSYAPATGVIVSPIPSPLNLLFGGTGNVTATVAPSNASQSVTWSSSNTSIATVNALGVVTAVGAGIATITATSTTDVTKFGTTTITVNYATTTGIDPLTPNPLSIVQGRTGTITARVLPTSANQSVTWISSNPAIAKVSLTGVVSGISVGSAIITATNNIGDQATATVNVNPNPASGGGGDVSPVTSGENVKVFLNSNELRGAHTDKLNGTSIEATIIGSELLDYLKNMSAGNIVLRIETVNESSNLLTYIDAGTLLELQKKNVLIETSTKKTIYQIPSNRLNISEMLKGYGASSASKDVVLQFEIVPSNDLVVVVFKSQVAKKKANALASPMTFKIMANYNGTIKQVVLNTPYQYISRWILTNSPDTQQLTAVQVEPSGTITHTPTKIITQDNKKYIVLQGIEPNGNYAILTNPVSFKDITNHWAKNFILDAGARTIVEGVGDNRFEADRSVTRAEFSAILIRGLGLQAKESDKRFTDVNSSDWFSTFVQTASYYGLITGYENNTFKPNQSISREEAMVMLARAMRMIDYTSKVSGNEGSLSSYLDASSVSSWALKDAELNLKAQTIKGDEQKKLRPKAPISRAETATVVIRLLDQASLIKFIP